MKTGCNHSISWFVFLHLSSSQPSLIVNNKDFYLFDPSLQWFPASLDLMLDKLKGYFVACPSYSRLATYQMG